MKKIKLRLEFLSPSPLLLMATSNKSHIRNYFLSRNLPQVSKIESPIFSLEEKNSNLTYSKASGAYKKLLRKEIFVSKNCFFNKVDSVSLTKHTLVEK